MTLTTYRHIIIKDARVLLDAGEIAAIEAN